MDEAKHYWPHAPMHSLTEQGAYMVTCGTYRRTRHLNTLARFKTDRINVLDDF